MSSEFHTPSLPRSMSCALGKESTAFVPFSRFSSEHREQKCRSRRQVEEEDSALGSVVCWFAGLSDHAVVAPQAHFIHCTNGLKKLRSFFWKASILHLLALLLVNRSLLHVTYIDHFGHLAVVCVSETNLICFLCVCLTHLVFSRGQCWDKLW